MTALVTDATGFVDSLLTVDGLRMARKPTGIAATAASPISPRTGYRRPSRSSSWPAQTKC
jgi:hypothetical protein